MNLRTLQRSIELGMSTDAAPAIEATADPAECARSRDTGSGRGGTLAALTSAIEAERAAILAGSGRYGTHALPLLALPSGTLARIAVATLVGRLASPRDGRRPTYSDLGAAIGVACYREWRLLLAHRDRGASPLPDLEELLAGRNSNSRGRRMARDKARAFVAKDWSREPGAALGGFLVDKAEACAIVATHAEHHHGKERIRRVALIATVDADRARSSADGGTLPPMLSPLELPMIVPPRPWRGLHGGGYLATRMPLVKHHGQRRQISALHEAARGGTLAPVLEAVNALQSTRWRINRPIYRLMLAARDTAIAIPGFGEEARQRTIEGELTLMQDRRRELRARLRSLVMRRRAQEVARRDAAPTAEMQHDAALLSLEWSRYRADVAPLRARIVERRALRSRVARRERLLAICRHIIEEIVPSSGHPDLPLYFPHILDYRGRAYTVPNTLTPQGDDPARALLEFADGEPLGPASEDWLAVQLANAYGEDKRSFAGRRAWVTENEEAIGGLAALVAAPHRDPAGALACLAPAHLTFWRGADAPWQFLAACREWAMRHDPGFRSHLPIALDATASGLQHLSALVGDRAGAAATNLIERDVPSDLYRTVAARLAAMVAQDAAAGHTSAMAWAQHIDRGTVKRGVMTTPYGVTATGRTRQLVAFLEEHAPGVSKEPWRDAQYLSGRLAECIDEIVTMAPLVMQWLKSLAVKMARDHNRGIAWTTPSGFPLVIEHYVQRGVWVTWTEAATGHKNKLWLRVTDAQTRRIDCQQQVTTIAPNVVHALDAAHLALTIRRLHDENIRHFATIHDSYAVHARHITRLQQVLREEFAAIYERSQLASVLESQLEEIRRGAQTTGPDTGFSHDRIPPPSCGSWDPIEVLTATYMFS